MGKIYCINNIYCENYIKKFFGKLITDDINDAEYVIFTDNIDINILKQYNNKKLFYLYGENIILSNYIFDNIISSISDIIYGYFIVNSQNDIIKKYKNLIDKPLIPYYFLPYLDNIITHDSSYKDFLNYDDIAFCISNMNSERTIILNEICKNFKYKSYGKFLNNCDDKNIQPAKIYLSFENSQNNYYFTEKLFVGYNKFNAVPAYWGGDVNIHLANHEFGLNSEAIIDLSKYNIEEIIKILKIYLSNPKLLYNKYKQNIIKNNQLYYDFRKKILSCFENDNFNNYTKLNPV